jgi:NADH-quinone oxidoreductase subunit C
LSSSDDAAPAAPVTDESDDEEVVETDDLREGLLAVVQEALGDAVVGHHIRPGDELWIRVTREAWVESGIVAREKLGCRFFSFLSAIDWMPSPFGRYHDAEVDTVLEGTEPKDPGPMEQGYAGGDTRFQVFARVDNLREHHGVIFKVDIPDDDLSLATWIPTYAGANWHERECWEMFGIDFTGHPFLRHLYLPGAFEGHPMRKDFPLLARTVKPWPGIVDVEELPPNPADEQDGDAADAETTGATS